LAEYEIPDVSSAKPSGQTKPTPENSSSPVSAAGSSPEEEIGSYGESNTSYGKAGKSKCSKSGGLMGKVRSISVGVCCRLQGWKLLVLRPT
jgi:hypothetical protein